jgi:hypothetical protein
MAASAGVTKREFARGLSPELMGAFDKGLPLRGVLDACTRAGCDIRLREDEVHAYHDGNRVAGLSLRGSTPRLEVHRKYLVDGIRHAKGAGRYVHLEVGAAFVEVWRDAVAEVIKKAKGTRRNPEGEWEHRLIRANGASKPVQILDRQVQLPGLKNHRLDLLGVVHREPGRTEIVAIELKQALNNDIQDVARQLARYVTMLQEDHGGLKRDIAAAYQTVARQMRYLGLDAAATADIAAGMPVRGLVVLAAYNDRSELLDRARRAASKVPLPLYYTILAKTTELPAAELWLPLTMDDR